MAWWQSLPAPPAPPAGHSGIWHHCILLKLFDLVIHEPPINHNDMHANQDICLDAANLLLQNLAGPSGGENACNIMSEDPTGLSHLEARIAKSITRTNARCNRLEKRIEEHFDQILSDTPQCFLASTDD